MKRGVFLIGVFLLAGLFALGQSRIRVRYRQEVLPDSADLEYYVRPKFGQAVATVVGLNMGTWVLDRYIQNADFAKISLSTIRTNFETGFIWDNDYLSTNMFLHPYHGNLYYNSARANGFNYWRSGLFAFAGSAMWEMFMEREYPSTNDIIATPIGGMAIGEVAFRASDLVLNDNSRGFERFGRELGAFLISPMRGITRIINGDAWRHRATSGRLFGIPHIALELSVGARALEFKSRRLDKGVGGTLELNIEYGERFEYKSTAPYDYFLLRANIDVQASQPVLGQLNIMGRLLSRELLENEKEYLSIGLYQHYDFFDSDTISRKSNKTPYRLGIPASVGVGVLYRGAEIKDCQIDAHAHLNAVLLGGILTDHYEFKDRNYNMGSGFSIKSGINFVYKKDLLSFSGTYDYYRLFTWGYPRETDLSDVDYRLLNSMGDDSAAYLGIAEARADVKIASRTYLTAGYTHYMRSTHYRDFPNEKSSTFAIRLMLTHKF